MPALTLEQMKEIAAKAEQAKKDLLEMSRKQAEKRAIKRGEKK